MCRNRKQRLCKLTDRWDQKILDILTRQNNRGILFTHTLHGVADIFDCRHVREKEIQFIDACRRIALTEKLIAHEGQDVKQHSIFEPLVRIH